MLLKLLTSLCGPTLSLARDDTHDFEDPNEAVRMVDAGIARPADPKVKAEIDTHRKVMIEQAAAAAEAETVKEAAADRAEEEAGKKGAN